MGKLSASDRKALPASTFAGPDRSYPIPDKGHAVAAESDASKAVNAGRMSKPTEERIDSRAKMMLDSHKKTMGH